MNKMNKLSIPYKALCTEYYELDKPEAPEDALNCPIEISFPNPTLLSLGSTKEGSLFDAS
jgi:hypothetical protein